MLRLTPLCNGSVNSAFYMERGPHSRGVLSRMVHLEIAEVQVPGTVAELILPSEFWSPSPLSGAQAPASLRRG